MREIKFRGWDTLTKTFVDEFMVNQNGVIRRGNHCAMEKVPEVDRYILEQFTGLLDKNGKEIYENDWVMLKGQKCLISLSDTSGAWHVSYPVRDDVDFPLENLLYWWYHMGTPDILVISNIHEKGE